MIYSDAFRAASIAVLALELYLAGFSLPLVLAVSFVLGTFTALFYPAQRSLLPTLIRPEEVADANGLILTANSVFQAVANGVGGALVAIAGVVVALGLNTATFAVSALLITLDRRPAELKTPGQRRGRQKLPRRHQGGGQLPPEVEGAALPHALGRALEPLHHYGLDLRRGLRRGRLPRGRRGLRPPPRPLHPRLRARGHHSRPDARGRPRRVGVVPLHAGARAVGPPSRPLP